MTVKTPAEPLAEVLARHNESDCTCPHEWKCPGRLYGVAMMDCWVRLWDQSDCPHHGRRRPKQPLMAPGDGWD